jgi:hypothetical protein
MDLVLMVVVVVAIDQVAIKHFEVMKYYDSNFHVLTYIHQNSKEKIFINLTEISILFVFTCSLSKKFGVIGGNE